ncbi:MAG TPA: hypothetical protein VN493_29910 [Thermoanaerobaculia bacterium]|nr:hypothetical protein [Thermoanaerobaculia bacterium]
MKRFALRLILGLLLAAVAIYPLYLVAGNWYLRSGDLERRLNRRPERLLIQTGSAWTLWPGVIHVRGFQIRNQTKTAQWWASVDSGTFRLQLLDLRDRELVITGLNGTGVSFRLRRRVDGRKWARPPRLALQPPIPGLTNPPARPPEVIYRQPGRQARARRDPWRIRLAQVDLDSVREIWIDEFRFAGEARIAGGFDMTIWRRLAVDPTRLRIVSGGISLGAGPQAGSILADASGQIDGEISPYSPAEHRGWNVFRFLSGRAEVEGTIPSLAFLDGYLRKTRWLRIDAKDGPVAVDLRMRRGQILPESRLEAKTERLMASTLEYRAEGPGRVVWEVLPGEDSRVALAFDTFQVTRRGQRQPHVRGKDLRIEAVNGPPRLIERDLFTPRRIAIEMPGAEVPDLSFYNAYLPRGSGLELTGGSGRMSARFRAAAPDWNGTGDIRLDARGVAGRFEGRPLRGDLAVRTLIREADFRGKRFDVSGTKLDLTRVSVPGSGLPGGDWWARLHLDQAIIEPGAPVFLRAKVESTLSDPRPIFAFVAPETRDRVLRWVDDLLLVQGIGAVADVAVGDGAVSIDDLAVAGGEASIQGRLRFGGAGKQGILYASYGRWDVGVELDGAQRDWKILRPKKWFANQMGVEDRTSGR